MSQSPRVPPLDLEDIHEDLRPILEKWPYRLHRTLAHSPQIMKAWMVFAEPVLLENSLSPRDREIAILRVAWNTQSAYEWGMHTMVARRVGMSEDDISAVIQTPPSPDLSDHETALVRAVDDIMRDWRISDANWTVLSETYSDQNFVDLALLVGEFLLVALTLNTLGVEPEEGLDPLPTS